MGRNMLNVKYGLPGAAYRSDVPPPHPPHTTSLRGEKGGGAGEGGKGKITENGRQTYKKKEIRSCIAKKFKFVTSGSDNVQCAYNGK